MKDRHLSASYTRLFKHFLSHTDEKTLLLRELRRNLRTLRPSSLLDIGAGNGELSIPLSRNIPDYVVIERKPEYVSTLYKAGLDVIAGSFPECVKRLPQFSFDAVLVSHSAPWHEDEYVPFLEAATSLVRKGGRLIVITYDNAESAWGRMRDACGDPVSESSRMRIASLKARLGTFGHVTCATAETHVRTSSLRDLMEALAFVYSDGDMERAELFIRNQQYRKYLDEHNRTKHGFEFPFEHLFYYVKCD
jgi:SAM-dependent methyltransferase